jgi:hypothetical protein
MMQTVKNASEFYRSDLAHAVSTLGAAVRSLERMQRYDLWEDLDTVHWQLKRELKELREEEKKNG